MSYDFTYKSVLLSKCVIIKMYKAINSPTFNEQIEKVFKISSLKYKINWICNTASLPLRIC